MREKWEVKPLLPQKEEIDLKKRSKNYQEAAKLVDSTKTYEITDAVEILKKASKANFDESVEVAFRLGVDPKKAEENLRGAVVLPHGTGKTQRVLVFAKGDKVKEAEDAGADYIGDADIIAKINEDRKSTRLNSSHVAISY